MTSFIYDRYNDDNLTVVVDELFNVGIIRTDDGIIVDVYNARDTECLGTICVFESDVAEINGGSI